MIADAEEPSNAKLTEIINYVQAASHSFGWVTESRPITFSLLAELHGLLMRGTP